MSWWKKPWMLPLLLAVVIVMGSNWYIKQIMHQDAVPKEEVKSRLETMYQGSVEQLTEGADGYEAEIRRNGALYSATVDHKTGKVLALTLLSEAEPEVAVKPEPEAEKAELAEDMPVAPVEKPAAVPLPKAEEQPKPAPAPEPEPKPAAKPVAKPQPKPAPAPKQSVLLTSQQAANIALRQLNAKVPVEVDDIDFVETQQGGYYLVELELDTDADADEVVYQIHAISGKVMSVEWDD